MRGHALKSKKDIVPSPRSPFENTACAIGVNYHATAARLELAPFVAGVWALVPMPPIVKAGRTYKVCSKVIPMHFRCG